jgi:hypothetical protein
MLYTLPAISFTRQELATIRRGPIWGWTAYRLICLPDLLYSLPAISFTRQELATTRRSPI